MKPSPRPAFASLLAGILLIFSLEYAEGHPDDRLEIHVPTLDETSADLLDVTDGSLEDWRHLVGEPVVSITDFWSDPTQTSASYDPGSADYSIWMAVHPQTSRLYLALQRWDDELTDLSPDGYLDGQLEIIIDGDHSGGAVGTGAHAQHLRAWLAADGTYSHSYIAGDHAWMNTNEYTDGSGAVTGRIRDGFASTESVLEMYMTAFDSVVADGVEGSRRSSFATDRIFSLQLITADVDEKRGGSYHRADLLTPTIGGIPETRVRTDDHRHCVPVGLMHTTVSPVTWGACKIPRTEGH